MNTEQLREFLTLAQLGNLTLASQKLDIPTSKLTSDMEALSQEVGLPLLIKNGRKTELSIYAKSFIPFAKEAVGNIDAGLEVISAIAYKTNETINLGISPLVNPKYISDLLFGFMSLYPHIHINISQNAAYPLVESLKRQEFDWLLCCDAITLFNDDELNYIPLIEMPFVVLVSKKNPLSKRKKLCISDLKDTKQIYTNKTTRDNCVKSMAAVFDQPPQTMVYSGDTTSIYELVANDIGIFFSTGFEHVVDNDRIAVIPLELAGRESEILMLVWTDKINMTPAHILLKNYLLSKKEL